LGQWQRPLESLVMPQQQISEDFWHGKKVFLTGHTGFKGSWLSLWLARLGAKVTGFARQPDTNPNLFDLARVGSLIGQSIVGDIRDRERLLQAVHDASPDMVIHMAAQPLVRYSYLHPVETYETNVMGTVNLLEAVRAVASVKACVVITTDKCYENQEREAGYSEGDPMGGYDPYSSSKGCAELIVSAYQRSYFPTDKYAQHGLAIATARAGNVIGGGDWSLDRLVPDAMRAFEQGIPLIIRNPGSTRPWQHVLEPLSGYLILAQSLYEHGCSYSGPWNFGPPDVDAISVAEIVSLLAKRWPRASILQSTESVQLHEANFLKLVSLKARDKLSWRPKWRIASALDHVSSWHRAHNEGKDMQAFTLEQIQNYAALNGDNL
jgi:CDP-glucose 4,6-dehydratase